MGRRASNVDTLVPGYREALSVFLGNAALEDSSVVLDGPGIGCGTHGVLLSLLGLERLAKLSAVHFFSSSGYAGLFLDARRRGQLTISRRDVPRWNRRNQHRHRVKPIVTACLFLGSKLIGKPWFFRNDLLAAALRSTVSDEYALAPVESLPANFHFWTFDAMDREFCDIHAASHYSHWSLADVISSLTAVPGLYEPFEKDGHVYFDALRAAGIRHIYRKLQEQSRNVLFWHMSREGRRTNTLFVRGHRSKSRRMRIAEDFGRFLLGIDNHEFNRSIELALFDLLGEHTSRRPMARANTHSRRLRKGDAAPLFRKKR